MVLGSGKRLFPDSQHVNLRLLDTQPIPAHVMLMPYAAVPRRHGAARRGISRDSPYPRRIGISARSCGSRSQSPPQTSAPTIAGKSSEKSGEPARTWVAIAPPR